MVLLHVFVGVLHALAFLGARLWRLGGLVFPAQTFCCGTVPVSSKACCLALGFASGSLCLVCAYLAHKQFISSHAELKLILLCKSFTLLNFLLLLQSHLP